MAIVEPRGMPFEIPPGEIRDLRRIAERPREDALALLLLAWACVVGFSLVAFAWRTGLLVGVAAALVAALLDVQWRKERDAARADLAIRWPADPEMRAVMRALDAELGITDSALQTMR